MRKIYSLCLGLLGLNYLFAQENLSGIINNYGIVESINVCNNEIRLRDIGNFSEGHDIIIIQMQGAQIDLDNSSSFGTITDLGAAGLYEKNQIASINGNTIVLAFQILNNYNPSARVQIISFPKFEDAVVVDTVKGNAWDGEQGGIIAFQVEDSLVLEAPIVANGIGFRGGISDILVENNCNFGTSANDYSYGTDDWRGAQKGEGVAQFSPGAENGRGPQGNGGGGGNDHNAGGGGGSNVTKAGQGGTNEEPSFFGCDGNFPGFGGKALMADSSRLFLGGGGGAGHENNDVGTNGGNGGGIIILSVGQLIANAFHIEAKGISPPEGGGDGGGGGGGGGTILLLYRQASELPVVASGGDGGLIDNTNQGRCHGPGGGGSGGHILSNEPMAPPSGQIAGGKAGLSFNSGDCNDGNNGAEPGSDGVITAINSLIEAVDAFGIPAIIEQPTVLNTCDNKPLLIPVLARGNLLSYQWGADQGDGFSAIQNGSVFQGVGSDSLWINEVTPEMANWQFKVLITNPCGANFFSDPISLNILPSPTAAFTFDENGQIFSFNNNSQNALTYLWDFGDGTTSTETHPMHTFEQSGSFPVTLSAYNECDTVQTSTTITIGGAPTASFSALPEEGCAPLSISFTNESTGEISSQAWLFPGGDPSFSSQNQVNVTYQQAGSYDVTLIVTNEFGVDSLTLTDYIKVGIPPVSDFTYTIDGLDVVVNNISDNEESIEWYVPALDINSMAQEATFTFAEAGTYVIQLTATNACGSVTSEQSISIGQAPNANFSFAPTGGCEQVSIQFTDQSTGSIDSYSWSFPGGTPESSIEPNPLVAYENAGLYTVSLSVSGPLGEENLVREGIVEVLLRPNPNFSFTIDGLSVQFQNFSSDASLYTWSFGDGTSSSETNPTHVYTEPGLYDVSLNAQNQYCGLAISQAVFLKPNATTDPGVSSGFMAYPNPFGAELALENKNPGLGHRTAFQLFNDLGQLIQQGTFLRQTRLLTNKLSSGVYWIRFKQEDKTLWQKLVKGG